MRDKLTEFYNAVNSKITLPEEVKQIIEREELPLFKSVNQKL